MNGKRQKSSASSCSLSVLMQGKAPQQGSRHSRGFLHPPLSSLTPRKQTSLKKTHQPRTFTPLPPRRNLRVTRSEAVKFHGIFTKFNTISMLRDSSQPSAPTSARSNLSLSPCDFKKIYGLQGARHLNKKKGARISIKIP